MKQDSKLILAMAEGDMGALAELYKRYAPGMRRFVTGLIKDKAKAEDIVQNIFLRLMSSNPSFENVTAFKNWLFVCARNEVVSTLRSKWESQVDRVTVLPERVSDGIQPEAMMPVLNSVLAKMPKKRSEVFRMSKLNGLSDEEIAARMGISVRTVQKHLELARREVSLYLN
jgi:RNA polymerase sigma-70 factor (ECF subfamily)